MAHSKFSVNEWNISWGECIFFLSLAFYGQFRCLSVYLFGVCKCACISLLGVLRQNSNPSIYFGVYLLVHYTGGWLMSKSFNKRLQTRHTHLIRTIRRGFRFAIHIMLVHLMVAENQPWKGGQIRCFASKKRIFGPGDNWNKYSNESDSLFHSFLFSYTVSLTNKPAMSVAAVRFLIYLTSYRNEHTTKEFYSMRLLFLFDPISEIVVIQVNCRNETSKRNNLPVKYSNRKRT